MKRLLSIGLAAALVAGSASASMAQGYRGYPQGRHYAQPHYNYGHNYRSNDNGAALAFGLLAFGTIAALAASNANRNYDYGYSYSYPQNYGYPGYGSYGYDRYSGYGYGYSRGYGYEW
jgi:hypothetical protein